MVAGVVGRVSPAGRNPTAGDAVPTETAVGLRRVLAYSFSATAVPGSPNPIDGPVPMVAGAGPSGGAVGLREHADLDQLREQDLLFAIDALGDHVEDLVGLF